MTSDLGDTGRPATGDRQDTDFSYLLKSAAILVVDDEPGVCNFLKRALENRCALLEVAGSAEEAEALRLRYQFDVLVVDIRLPGLSGLDWLARLRERGVKTHVIYMTAYADLDMAVGALRNDAEDFIIKPFRTEQMLISIRRTLTRGQILRENSLLRLQLQHVQPDVGFIGQSDVVQQLLAQAQRWAPTDSCVLINGEGGTGKRLLASSVHNMSRRSGQLVSVSCGALSADTAEAELFGEEGLFVHAHQGTLLLVDVELLSPGMQAKLYYALEHKKPGLDSAAGHRAIDVRVIATSSVDLQQLADLGSFRRDLQLRLSTLPLTVPALRERGTDIQLLADQFMQQLSTRLRLAPVELLHEHRQTLSDYSWPGNVSELKNVIERTLLLGELPEESFWAENMPTEKTAWQGPGYPLDQSLESVERAHIEAVLASLDNNKSAAARVLGVSRKTLERKQALWYGAAGDS